MFVAYDDALGTQSSPPCQMLVSQIHLQLVHLLTTVTDLPGSMHMRVLHHNISFGVFVPIEELVIILNTTTTPTCFFCWVIFLNLHQIISLLRSSRLLVNQLHLRHAVLVRACCDQSRHRELLLALGSRVGLLILSSEIVALHRRSVLVK